VRHRIVETRCYQPAYASQRQHSLRPGLALGEQHPHAAERLAFDSRHIAVGVMTKTLGEAEEQNGDPLSVRTGLPFDFILDLVAQAQAWRYLGRATEVLGKLGLGNALSICRLVDRLAQKLPHEEAKAVLTASANLLQLDETVVKIFRDRGNVDSLCG
jgi:hypothetical protein